MFNKIFLAIFCFLAISYGHCSYAIVDKEEARKLAATIREPRTDAEGKPILFLYFEQEGEFEPDALAIILEPIAENLRFKGLEFVDNNLRNEDVQAIIKAYKKNTHVRSLCLDIENNPLNDESVRTLTEYLRANPSLSELTILGEPLEPEYFRNFIFAMKKNYTLRSLSVASNIGALAACNNLADEPAIMLAHYLSRNKLISLLSEEYIKRNIYGRTLCFALNGAAGENSPAKALSQDVIKAIIDSEVLKEDKEIFYKMIMYGAEDELAFLDITDRQLINEVRTIENVVRRKEYANIRNFILPRHDANGKMQPARVLEERVKEESVYDTVNRLQQQQGFVATKPRPNCLDCHYDSIEYDIKELTMMLQKQEAHFKQVTDFVGKDRIRLGIFYFQAHLDVLKEIAKEYQQLTLLRIEKPEQLLQRIKDTKAKLKELNDARSKLEKQKESGDNSEEKSKQLGVEITRAQATIEQLMKQLQLSINDEQQVSGARANEENTVEDFLSELVERVEQLKRKQLALEKQEEQNGVAVNSPELESLNREIARVEKLIRGLEGWPMIGRKRAHSPTSQLSGPKSKKPRVEKTAGANNQVLQPQPVAANVEEEMLPQPMEIDRPSEEFIFNQQQQLLQLSPPNLIAMPRLMPPSRGSLGLNFWGSI